jgi:hypothetical protein
MRDNPRITINAAGSVVTMEFRDHIGIAELKAHADRIDALPSKVQPGFTALVDLTGLGSMDPESVPTLSLIMERLGKAGVARVVRVIPDPRKDIGLGILSLFHYKSGVKINTVPTRAEADRLVS